MSKYNVECDDDVTWYLNIMMKLNTMWCICTLMNYCYLFDIIDMLYLLTTDYLNISLSEVQDKFHVL